MTPTAWFIVLVLVEILAWNTAAWAYGGQQETISGHIQWAVAAYPELVPAIAVIFIVLFAHWCLQWF